MTLPPRILVALLEYIVAGDGADTIAGDLIEEYNARTAGGTSRLAANAWLIRQSLSLVPNRLFTGRRPMRAQSILSIFMVLAGLWLAYMETVLGHPGHDLRAAIDLLVVFGSVLSLVWLVHRKSGWLQVMVGIYALGAVAFGAHALWDLWRGPEFEGFVLVIATAMCLQGILMLAGFFRKRDGLGPHRPA